MCAPSSRDFDAFNGHKVTMIHTKIDKIECPYCLTQFDAAFKTSNVGRKKPHPGDPSLCLMCGKISVFDERLGARMPNAEELDDHGVVGLMYAYLAEPGPKAELARMIAAFRAAHGASPGPQEER